MAHNQNYLNEFHRQNSEACIRDLKKQKEQALTVDDVLKQSTKQGRAIKILKHGSN